MTPHLLPRVHGAVGPRRSLWLCFLVGACFLLLNGTWARAQWEQKMVGPTSLDFSPDGRQLAAGSIEDWVSPGDLKVWDTKSGKLLHKERYAYGVESLAFSPDGKTLAVATDVEQAKYAIRLWNVRSWRVEHAMGSGLYLISIAFSPDGKQLVSGSNMAETGDTQSAYLWNVSTRRSRELPRSNGLARLFFSPRTHLLLGGFYSGYYNDDSEDLRAWNDKGRFLWRRRQPGLSGTAFLPDGKTFLAGVGKLQDSKKPVQGALQVRDAATGRLLYTIKQPQGVIAVAVSRDGKTWATGDNRGTVSLWNAQTRHITKTMRLHRDAVGVLKFSPDGRFLASAGDDNMVLLTVLR